MELLASDFLCPSPRNWRHLGCEPAVQEFSVSVFLALSLTVCVLPFQKNKNSSLFFLLNIIQSKALKSN